MSDKRLLDLKDDFADMQIWLSIPPKEREIKQYEEILP